MGSNGGKGEHDAVVALYREGVTGVCQLAGGLRGRDWHRSTCGDWSAQEVARHLLAIADWHHHWLDRATDDNLDPPFSLGEFDDRNELEVHNRRAVAGHEAIVLFKQSADSYLDRVLEQPPLWDLPLGTPSGPTTVGAHVVSAASEWHLHAWDLGRTIGVDHASTNPQGLVLAPYQSAIDLDVSLRPVFGRLRAKIAARNPRRDPWHDLLVASGRQP